MVFFRPKAYTIPLNSVAGDIDEKDGELSDKAEENTISFKPVEGNIPALVDENGEALSDEAAGEAIVQNSENPINSANHLKQAVLILGAALGFGFGKNEYGRRTLLSEIKGVAIGTTASVLLCKVGPVLLQKDSREELVDDVKAGWKYANEQKQQGNSGVSKFAAVLTNIRYDGQPCSPSDYDPDP